MLLGIVLRTLSALLCVGLRDHFLCVLFPPILNEVFRDLEGFIP